MPPSHRLGSGRTRTDTSRAPWYLANTDDKRRGRLAVITHLLASVPDQPLPHRKVTLPERQKPDGYAEPALQVRRVPALT